ncbi:helix-turn-helix domain-containing protein [Paenibacillus turpanensis]|uniref:helix-turn-helix domain-containing protein n=1 Tax=Paenibacillus turpanensis TaxID=2689078 RepID=UPI00140E3BCD|nr:helix-turn-helix domain-containing protein [Paenibacillus turpanensis]
MDSAKVGRLIQSLRKEKNMTQRDLALLMDVSEQAISKWERGIGCPDISLLSRLSEILGVNIEKILSGELRPNDQDSGRLGQMNWFSCKGCGNVITSTGGISLSCCGRILEPLQPNPINEEHSITVEEVEDDYYVTLKHEMSRDHYISFLAYVSLDRVLIVKLYPEQDAEARFPKMYGGTLYFHCKQHGLFQYDLRRYRGRRGPKGEESITDH